MKKIVLLAGIVLLAVTVPAQTSIKLMSFNIRLDVESDGENKWDLRKEKVAALMNHYDADFIGAQEVQHHQLQYLQQALNGYSYIGVGRDDGKTKGEYSCIFYNTSTYTMVKQGTFWLSATPDTVSMGWDAACNRVCTWGLFKNNKTKQLVWVMNTHFDHVGVQARENAAKLILDSAKQFQQEKNVPLFLTGDFNTRPEDRPFSILSKELQYARPLSEEPAYGPADTWNGFKFREKPDGCIDYIFTTRMKNIHIKKYSTLTDSDDMKYPSDHFPVLAECEIDPN